MISKELLSEVMGFNIKKDDIKYGKNCISFGKYVGDYPIEYINIYELAHKCKEWLLNQDSIESVTIAKNHDRPLSVCIIQIGKGDWSTSVFENFNDTNEQDLIFQACQWKLDRNKK